MNIIPAWRALPLWAKIVTFPMILSASVTILVVSAYTLLGVFYAISAAFESVGKWFGKARNAANDVARRANRTIDAATA